MDAVLILLLSTEIAALPSIASHEVQRVLEARRPEGFGPPYVRAEARSDLNEDQVLDLVTLYEYQIGPAQDRGHTQYLVAFLSDATGYVPTESRIVGGKYKEVWETLEVDGQSIHLKGVKWLAGDGGCCPTGTAQGRFEITAGQLVEIEGS